MLNLLVTLGLTATAALAAAGVQWIRDRSRERLYRTIARSLPRGGSMTEQQPDGSAWELRIPPDGDAR
ncbi:hypothetical protein C9J60_10015 [Streptomyces sp. A244]|uniref:hypothetical protein n=1 Tax=Streptomyces TaxID=1883 RepID=UPI000D45DC2C|nr:hypothetical protein [Streptomyces sp. A244]PTH89128.1 hypothetical protein C9J60_10015 [Streptomyces sp. A244]